VNVVNTKRRELDVRQVSRALNIPYNDIYRTIRFHAIARIPVRKHRGRLMIPEDALPLLQRIHYERKHPRIPNGWIRLADFCRQHNLRNYQALRWAKKLGIARRFPVSNGYYIHEDSDKIHILLSICRTGQPPKDEWVLLTDAVRSKRLRTRVHSLLYLVEPIRIGKSIYLRRDDLELLKQTVTQR
jgi:hypothetical protein